MSLLKTIKAQLGLSGTPGNNFVLDASANNGTMKLARGNAGATTQDIMTVAADGTISFPGLAKSLAESGYFTLPNGLIVQWGTAQTTATSNAVITLPIPFPTRNAARIATPMGAAAAMAMSETHTLSTTTFLLRNENGAGVGAGVFFTWIAIGF